MFSNMKVESNIALEQRTLPMSRSHFIKYLKTRNVSKGHSCTPLFHLCRKDKRTDTGALHVIEGLHTQEANASVHQDRWTNVRTGANPNHPLKMEHKVQYQ